MTEKLRPRRVSRRPKPSRAPAARAHVNGAREYGPRCRKAPPATSRALRLLLGAEKALGGARSQGELLAATCRLTVELGGFRLAVAGCADGPQATAIRRIADHGCDEDLDCVRRAWASATSAPGLAATALRTERGAVSNDLLSDRRMACSSEEAARLGHAAAAALPILPRGDRPCVLLVVSSKRDDFDTTTVEALRCIASDAAHRLEALRTAALLAGVVDHAPVPFYVMGSDGRFTLVSRAWEETTGRRRDEALGRCLEEVFAAESARLFRDVNARVLGCGRAFRAEEEAVVRGERRVFDTVKFPVRNAEGRFDAVAGFSLDVTDRRRAEDRLSFQARLLEEISDAVIAIDPEERITYANRSALERYAPGASIGEVLGRRLGDFYEYRWNAPRDRERAERELAAPGTWRGEVVHVRRDGTSWPVDASVVALRDEAGRPAGSFAVLRDISERKMSENALRASREELRALALRLQTVREEEKARIARDLHDELGQLVTALQLIVREIERRLEASGPQADGAVVERVVGASELLDRMAASVRRIAAELRPRVLDQLGLSVALEQEAQRFARHTGIACRVRPGSDMPELPPQLATTLYRIAQEALTNVARHARATCAEIVLAVCNGEVTLLVEDDGCGPPVSAGGRRGLGVLGMQERAGALGGEVRIERREGGGTRVAASIPLLRAPAGGDR